MSNEHGYSNKALVREPADQLTPADPRWPRYEMALLLLQTKPRRKLYSHPLGVSTLPLYSNTMGQSVGMDSIPEESKTLYQVNSVHDEWFHRSSQASSNRHIPHKKSCKLLYPWTQSVISTLNNWKIRSSLDSQITKQDQSATEEINFRQ